MKKFIISSTLFLAALAGGLTASAQTQTCPQNNCTKQTQCTTAQNCGQQNCTPGSCTPGSCAPQSCAPGARRGGAPRCNAFEGLNLSDQQKSQLKALGQDCKAQRDKKQCDGRKERLAKIKTILTPEQYTQFLENNFVQGGNRHGKDMKRHHGKAKRIEQKADKK